MHINEIGRFCSFKKEKEHSYITCWFACKLVCLPLIIKFSFPFLFTIQQQKATEAEDKLTNAKELGEFLKKLCELTTNGV